MPLIGLFPLLLQVGSSALQVCDCCASETLLVIKGRKLNITAAIAAALQQNRLLIPMYGADTSAREQHFRLFTKGRCRP